MNRRSIQPRLVIAGVVAAIGVIVAVWRLWPYLASGQTLHASGRQPTPQQVSLGPDLLDKSTRDDGPGAVVQAAARARVVARQAGIPPSRLDDLVAAFTEQLSATIDADLERDHAARLARGLAWDGPPPAQNEDYRQAWQKMAEWMRGRAIGVETLEVRVLMQDGIPLAPSGVDEGYDTLTAVNHDYPLPADPAAVRADVIEVRLPMDVPTINGKGRGAALIGYRFLWGRASGKWIPFANAIYGDPEAIYAGIAP